MKSYPVKHDQVHPHEKSGRGEVNPLREVGEYQMVVALHIVSVTVTQGTMCKF